MIPSWAKPGAKVVCVDDFPLPGHNWHPRADRLVKGNIYTVTGVEPGVHGDTHLAILAGMRNVIGGTHQIGYSISRFRPLITEADDIALFKSLLNPTLVDKLDLLAERMNELAED